MLDDFLEAIPKPDSFEELIAIMIIKRRYLQKRPLIISTELEPRHFKTLLPRHGEALLGRIFEMCNGRTHVMPGRLNYRFTNTSEENESEERNFGR